MTARIIMVLPETARRDPRRGEIPVMRISCPLLSDFPAAGERRNKLHSWSFIPSERQRHGVDIYSTGFLKTTEPRQGSSVSICKWSANCLLLPLSLYLSAHLRMCFFCAQVPVPFLWFLSHVRPWMMKRYRHITRFRKTVFRANKWWFCTRKAHFFRRVQICREWVKKERGICALS